MSRPLIGEPLALELVNTQWMHHGRLVDLFDEPGGVESWIAETGLPGVPDAREPLIVARAALRAALGGDEQPLNDVLDRGARRPQLRDGLPVEELVLDSPEWLPAWVAAADLVRLRAERAERIRKCANPDCVLWFYDISKNGRRRWCSMDACGNRAKTDRYQQRHRTT
ncbi:CGNR zinc finger domain-containing protein [Actinomadura hibisca]|uniref:CGNR zinc finger domain-containing protein n=1 Tax=Actinomadura hibisca TaxID=68565 RepID=UPI000833C311|nr:CGNR zinc finger domain-containing protein [Actinomadura hibisca]